MLLNIANCVHTLAVLPTVFGKSDLFILAPLISLMSDIKEKFKLKGVEVGPIYCLYTTLFLICMNEFII